MKLHSFSSIIPDKGRFTPKYSNEDAIRKLIDDAWEQATQSDIGPAYWGNIVIAASVFQMETETHAVTPSIIGQSATGRPAPSIPTNTYIVIVDRDLNVLTCYPINPLDAINPQKDVE
jgi:hypothetical protein